ncbi:hypothetical protein [Streptomyces sp. NPDC046862]|uniref:hypothetical protein n=1 Tax=Streptomyces sp. NPDC046862 TaxID=3154603 RepID=UPI0034534E01
MTNAGEVSGGLASAVPAAPSQLPHLTTHIPDVESTSLSDLLDVRAQSLNRLLPSARQSGSSFNSSI